MTEGTLQVVHGVPIHWVERGRGRPTVLLHGIADSHLTWLPLAQRFPDRRLLLVDLPGHGLSGRPDASYEPGWYANLLGAWWDSLGLEDVDLVGHSYGGAVAQSILLSHAARVRSLSLLAPGGWGREVGVWLKALSLPGAEHVIAPFLGIGTRLGLSMMGIDDREHLDSARWLASRPGSARALVRTARAAIDLRGQRILASDRADGSTSLPPTLMLWGDRDPVLPVAQASRAAQWIEGLQLKIYPRCGHMPHLERTEEVASDVRRFLDEGPHVPARIVVPAPIARRPSWWRRAWRWVASFLRGPRAA